MTPPLATAYGEDSSDDDDDVYGHYARLPSVLSSSVGPRRSDVLHDSEQVEFDDSFWDVRSVGSVMSDVGTLRDESYVRVPSRLAKAPGLEDGDEAPPRPTLSHVNLKRRVERAVRWLVTRNYAVLFLLGVCVSLLTFGIDLLVEVMFKGLQAIFDAPIGIVGHLAASTLYRSAMMGLAVFITTFCAQAAGSGIPELKAIMSGGVSLSAYLTLRAGLVKTLALCCVLGSGLYAGKEGPFVHISSTIALGLRQFSWFKRTSRHATLAAASAAGIAACFGSPIGGVLFAVEVTQTFFLTRNYALGFFVACVGAVLTKVLNVLRPTTLLLFKTGFTGSEEPFKDEEMIGFASMGLVAGVLGALFIRLHVLIIKWRRKYQTRLFGKNPYGISIFVVVIFSLATCYREFLRRPYRETIDDLLSLTPLTSDSSSFNASDWNSGWGVYANLSAYFVAMFVFSCLVTSLPVPCGVFAPMFATGCALGKLVGLVLRKEGMVSAQVVVTAYSVVGGAAMASSVTQTISAGVIVLEVTGQLNLLLPVLLAVVVATGISSMLGRSIYTAIIEMKRLPLLAPDASTTYHHPHRVNAGHLVELLGDGCFPVSRRPTTSEIEAALASGYRWFPIVHSHATPILQGQIDARGLALYSQILTQHMRSDSEVKPPSLFTEQLAPYIQQSPFQLEASTTLRRVYFLFHMLHPDIAYITSRGVLIGSLTEAQLISVEQEARKHGRITLA